MIEAKILSNPTGGLNANRGEYYLNIKEHAVSIPDISLFFITYKAISQIE